MKIVLKSEVRGLGKIGEICDVRDGYGRNFLLPKGYAVVATKKNIEDLNKEIDELKKNNDKKNSEANNICGLLNNEVFNVVRQASDDGTIFGSVRNKDVYNLINEFFKKNNIKFYFEVGAIKIENPIKSIGQYIISVNLFGDVIANVYLNVCRSVSDFESDVANFTKKLEEANNGSKTLVKAKTASMVQDKLDKKAKKMDLKNNGKIVDNEKKEDIKTEEEKGKEKQSEN